MYELLNVLAFFFNLELSLLLMSNVK